MGISNVKKVITLWGDLPHVPFRALVYMAMRSIDADETPVYRAGWEELAQAIGRQLPDEDLDDKATVRERKAAQTAVTRALKILTQSNAIRVQKHAGPGHRAVWSLTLDYRTVCTQPRQSGDELSALSGPNCLGSAGQLSRLSLPTVYAEPRPKEYEEVLRNKERNHGDLDLNLAATRVSPAESEDPNLDFDEGRPPSLRVVKGGGKTTPAQPGLWPTAVPNPATVVAPVQADAPCIEIQPTPGEQARAELRTKLAQRPRRIA
jgi:hypothetical protein